MGSSSRTRKKHSKKKSSKLSSKARNMKKSKRTKSRKLGRRHDSSTDDSMNPHSISSADDSYSDYDSTSSKSVSTSSSSDTYRRRSKRSRLKRNVKKRKSKTGRRSSSREDSRDLSRSRKRKKSKKNDDSKSRKKTQRKKLRRDAEISSASSDSRSCPTCDDSVSDSERVRRSYRENKKVTRDRRKRKLGTPLRASRSPRHSSYGGYQDENRAISQSEETSTVRKNSRRLRSVIVFVEKPEPSIGEENESERNMQNEELVYDHDDYPSKSSSGEGSKRVPTHCPPNASDDVQLVENVGFISDNGVTELTGSRIDTHVHNPSLDEFETNSYIKKDTNNVPLPDLGSSGNDLEAILKQKALENLKKFRGAVKTNVKRTAHPKDEDNSDYNGPSSSKTEIVESKLSQQEAGFTELEKDISEGELSGKVLGTGKQSLCDPPDVAHSSNPKEESPPKRRPDLGKSAMAISSSGKTSSGIDSTQKQTKSAVEASVDKSYMETSLRDPEPKIDHLKSSGIDINEGTGFSSALVESVAPENQSLNNRPDEAKDGSQYQQKTMSVMRGGEMVQVNYKVYIPKRAPALGRRQFNR